MSVQAIPSGDDRFAKEWLEDCSDADFNLAMEELDQDLRQENVPIFARQMRAIEYVCRRGEYSLFLGEPLAERICLWFKEQFGNRLNYDMSLGYGPVLIRGDLYCLRVPWLIYGGTITCSASSNIQPSGQRLVVNVLDFIDGLTGERKNLLSQEELASLQSIFLRRTDEYLSIREVQNDAKYKAALGDLQVANDCLFQARPFLGNSRWHCLQSVEKFLKGWLQGKVSSIPRTHDLTKLRVLAESAGLPTLNRQEIDIVQCEASVRYDDAGLGFLDSVQSYNATLSLCSAIAEAAKVVRPTRVQQLPGIPLSLAEFRSLAAGDYLITSGGMSLEVVGIQQLFPHQYLTMVQGATKHTMITEEDHSSFARKA